MRALAIRERGAAPAVSDVEAVTPGRGELRVAVEAASVNGFDLAVAAGFVWDAMPHTFPVVLGRDFAGTVQAVGADVEGVHTGDLVAGVLTALELGSGPIAEQIVVPAAAVTAVPAGVSAALAAAVGLAGITALDAVDALNVGDEDVLLISGATGGVGAFAVQIAAARGARVLATARPGAASEFVRRLGAEAAVDYTGDLAAAVHAVAPEGVTTVLHAAGDPTVLAGLLMAGGRLASIVGATTEQAGRADVTVAGVMGSFTPDKLHGLLEQVGAGTLTVPVAATHPLADAAAALTSFGAGKLGKIMVTVP
ncbi:MAG: Alcohol dehydrogenase GroES domain protein [Blastococcus sp.]|jgi:NADPH:quinone reductase-like Zn-dependent oxidoreductase|nr:Alcohol dehydrogenase GroES domain protein [Blastococcus sp.]